MRARCFPHEPSRSLMWIDYTDEISESVEKLRELEKKRSTERSVADRL